MNRLGWAWLVLVALIAVGTCWGTRYGSIYVSDAFNRVYVWDRLRHRVCSQNIYVASHRDIWRLAPNDGKQSALEVAGGDSAEARRIVWSIYEERGDILLLDDLTCF